MGKIKNTESLLNHGDRESRKKITELLERMWAKVDAYHLIKELMSVDGNRLTIGTKRWDMDKLGNIYLFGAGKACNAMAMAVCDVLKEKLTEGVISVKLAEDNDTYINTRVYVGGHPLPNEEGYRAAEDIIQMIDKGKPGDLFISVISGGSSALLTCPKEGITLQEEIQAQDMLLRSGASLSEVSSLFEEDGMDTALRQASTEISLSVAAGETFSAAAEKTGVFPEYALSVFSTAELSGRLDEALDRLADHYDRQSALYDRLRSTLTYPAVLMLMMCGVLAVLVLSVLPIV